MIPILSSLALAALLAGAPRELPGRCMPPSTPMESLEHASAVFVGRVVSQRESTRIMRSETRNESFEVQETEHTFVIDASWKLPAGVTDTVRIWTYVGFESPTLHRGEDYMVYASETRFFPGRLYAGNCSPTTAASRASEDFAALGRPIRGRLPVRGYRQPASRRNTP
ncbi:hypothetical protein [Longimicrobium terrae]|uniref:Uncharacterized protein n=1 Tax=Longimicrobium terrae TaxID=1639882 RepID=A0A841H3P8_9BACT|nr:hypothetical protein [Longimicrobium terrae]MBB4638334.1 hypothetical protein [Longimicrobium terrae]MBB6072598.1 hypothetical protein [Longimicrobium terrae]NNC28623.1 hypothetical protein [Longimicrobium terrae]